MALLSRKLACIKLAHHNNLLKAMRIEIYNEMQRQLGLIGYDSRHVNVKLTDGRIFKNLIIREDWFITGRVIDLNGEGELGFTAADIKKIRKHSIFPFWY